MYNVMYVKMGLHVRIVSPYRVYHIFSPHHNSMSASQKLMPASTPCAREIFILRLSTLALNLVKILYNYKSIDHCMSY